MEGTLDDGRLDAAETATTDATGSGWMHAIKLDNPSYSICRAVLIRER